MVLSELKEGQSCLVVKLKLNNNIKRRLSVLGLTSGVKVKVIKIAPFFDPVEIEVRGYRLAIRRDTLNGIEVELGE